MLLSSKPSYQVQLSSMSIPPAFHPRRVGCGSGIRPCRPCLPSKATSMLLQGVPSEDDSRSDADAKPIWLETWWTVTHFLGFFIGGTTFVAGPHRANMFHPFEVVLHGRCFIIRDGFAHKKIGHVEPCRAIEPSRRGLSNGRMAHACRMPAHISICLFRHIALLLPEVGTKRIDRWNTLHGPCPLLY